VPYFLCRLVAPRPDFAMTMTDDERAVMGQHAAYLGTHGSALVVYGPVLDPAGPWGLAVFEFATEAELRAILDRDPIILSGRGFRYDVLPMLTAIRGPAPAN
jgi:hypothetical protein